MDGRGRPRLEQAVESNAGAIAEMRGSDLNPPCKDKTARSVTPNVWASHVGWVEARSADTQQRMLR